MEAESFDGETEKEGQNGPVPTARDLENARIRQVVSARQAEEYGRCLKWAITAFGMGWEPSGRHYLLEKEEEEKARRTGERPKAAATVHTVRNSSGEKRHFTVDEQGQVTECSGYEQGFGAMLLEPHPSRTIEVRGEIVHPQHFSLCWAGYELYEPKSADELAKLRESRERKWAKREEKKWQEDNPLLSWAGLHGKEEK